MFDLSGKKFLVTGSGSSNGIGFASAKALQALGATVYLTSLSERVLKRGLEINAAASCANLTKPLAVKQLILGVIQTLGSLDGVVNNAGMTSVLDTSEGEFASIDDTTIEKWQKSFARNVESAFLVTKEAIPHIRKSKAGRIVMMSSVSGPLLAIRNDVAYPSAKAALVGLVRSLAIDEAQNGITVNAVAPGWVASESQSESEAIHSKATPIGRAGTPDEMAAAVAWLCTNEASYITGQMLVLDGGNSLPEQRYLPN